MQDNFSREESRALRYGTVSAVLFASLFCFMAFSSHKSTHVDEQHYHLTATFGRTDGLLVGDKVRMAGIDVGRVVDAVLDEDYEAVLTLEIREDVKIPDDSSASIISAGLMGSKYIEIEPGGSDEFLENGGTFSYTQDAMVLEELLDRIVAIGRGKRRLDDATQNEKENIDE